MSDHHHPLRLLANDAENLHIISAMLQDALLPVTAMVFDEQEHTFSFLANRFCWEIPEEIRDNVVVYHRVHAGVAFKSVKRVDKRNFNENDAKRVLGFLALSSEVADGKTYITFHFSDDHDIRLEVNSIDCIFADIDHPWPTQKLPVHMHEYLEEFSRIRQ